MSAENNPFESHATHAEDTLILGRYSLGLPFWLIWGIGLMFSLLATVGGLVIFIWFAHVLIFTLIRSLRYQSKVRQFQSNFNVTPLARPGITVFFISLIISAVSSIACWIAFAAICIPAGALTVGIMGIVNFGDNFGFGALGFVFLISFLFGVLVQWLIVKTTIPTSFEIQSTPPPINDQQLP